MNSNNTQVCQENYEDIKEALEYQIDIVLRLEEERLGLLNEVKLLRQKIKELTEKPMENNKVIKKEMKNAETQASITMYARGQDIQTQTDQQGFGIVEIDEEYLGDSVLQYSQNLSMMTLEEDREDEQQHKNTQQHNKTNELFEKAHEILRKTELKNSQETAKQTLNSNNSTASKTITKKPIVGSKTSSMMAKSSLQFKKKEPAGSNQDYDSQRSTETLQQENSSRKYGSTTSSQMFSISGDKDSSTYNNDKKLKDQQSDILAQELVKLTRENNAMKKETQKISELQRKGAKENSEMRRMLEVKNEMLEKLRIEVAELSLLLNSDKNKSIRTIESQLRKEKDSNIELRRDYERAFQEKQELKEELQQFKGILSKLSSEYEKISTRSDVCDNETKAENTKLKQKITELEQSTNFIKQQQSISAAVEKEYKLEISKMQEEIDYYKHVAQKSKEYASKAIADIDFYRDILNKNNITLS